MVMNRDGYMIRLNPFQQRASTVPPSRVVLVGWPKVGSNDWEHWI